MHYLKNKIITAVRGNVGISLQEISLPNYSNSEQQILPQSRYVQIII